MHDDCVLVPDNARNLMLTNLPFHLKEICADWMGQQLDSVEFDHHLLR